MKRTLCCKVLAMFADDSIAWLKVLGWGKEESGGITPLGWPLTVEIPAHGLGLSKDSYVELDVRTFPE